MLIIRHKQNSKEQKNIKNIIKYSTHTTHTHTHTHTTHTHTHTQHTAHDARKKKKNSNIFDF